jgi:glycosyltransferase involved in cell wall biosynthesis
MQIAYVLSQYPARSETFIAREMQELSARGHDLTIARLRWSDTEAGIEVPDAEVLPLKWNPIAWMLGVQWAARRAPRALARMGRDLLGTARPSVTWARLLVLSLISLALARTLHGTSAGHLRAHFLDSEAIASYWISDLLDVPFSLTLHTLDTRFSPSLLTQVVEDAAFCAVISEDVTARLAETPARPNKIVRIRNGVRGPEEPPAPLPSSPSPWRLLAVGRLVEKKGFDVLVEACERLDAWDCPFHCTVIGDGPLRSSLEARARQHNLAHRITFRGAQSNETVLRAMQQHHVLVVPSRPARDGTRDGIPTVLLEALSYGRTVVASRFAGIPELVKDGETGRLVPPDDPLALAEALRSVFDDPQQAAAMGRAGRECVRRDFSLKREVKKLETLICESKQALVC